MFSLPICGFSPSAITSCRMILQISAHWIYISLWAELQLIVIWFLIIWSILGLAIVDESALCFGACKMHCFKWDWCLHSLDFQDKGEDRATPSESLWTLQLLCWMGGFSNPQEIKTNLQRQWPKIQLIGFVLGSTAEAHNVHAQLHLLSASRSLMRTMVPPSCRRIEH